LPIACATPDEVKQAATALDKSYADNAQLMQKYEDTVKGLNELHHKWVRYLQSREFLSLSLECATIDQSADTARLPARLKRLGPGIQAWINSHRLKGLPQVEGLPQANGVPQEPPLQAGTATVGQLIEGLPALVFLVHKQVDASIASGGADDFSGFDKYAKDVTTLRAANKAIKQYLDIDVTVSSDDVKEIAGDLATLRGSK